MTDKLILGLTGPIATGKTTLAKYLAETYGAKIYSFSAPLRDVLNRLYIPLERPNLALVSNIMRANFGDSLISQTIAQDIQNDDSPFIILDGIRRLPDIETIQSLPNFHLLALDALTETRWQRMTTRGQNLDDGSKTFEQFQNDEQAEADRDIPQVMAQASTVLDNNGSLEDLYHQAETYLKNNSFIIN